MFSTEIKVNNILIAHLYVHNSQTISINPEICDYFYRYYKVDTGKVTEGRIFHQRDLGIEKLILGIMREIYNAQNDKEDGPVVKQNNSELGSASESLGSNQ